VRTPLVRLGLDDAPAEIYLKLENMQPIGYFKIRAAGSAMSRLSPEQLARGVLTASTGNMAQGVAWNARRMGIPCTVVMPETAPPTKIQAVERLGGRIIHVSFDRWWQTFTDRAYRGVDASFVHPFDDLDVMAGLRHRRGDPGAPSVLPGLRRRGQHRRAPRSPRLRPPGDGRLRPVFRHWHGRQDGTAGDAGPLSPPVLWPLLTSAQSVMALRS
jgi:hypothetical protein